MVSSVYHKVFQEHFTPMLEKIGSFLDQDVVDDGRRAQLGQLLMSMSESAQEGIGAIFEEYFKGNNEEFAKFTEKAKDIDY